MMVLMSVNSIARLHSICYIVHISSIKTSEELLTSSNRVKFIKIIHLTLADTLLQVRMAERSKAPDSSCKILTVVSGSKISGPH